MGCNLPRGFAFTRGSVLSSLSKIGPENLVRVGEGLNVCLKTHTHINFTVSPRRNVQVLFAKGRQKENLSS